VSIPKNIRTDLLKCRMVMLDDILLKDESTLIDSISVDSSFIFIKQPEKCPHCKSKGIVGIEVMGAYTGRLLWECEDCESYFLRFTKKATEKYLQSARDLWTNPEDWSYVPRSEFN
jgi:transposase-like protein